MNEGFIAAAKLARQRADKHVEPSKWKDMTSRSEHYVSAEMYLDELSQTADVAWKAYVSKILFLFNSNSR
jgi:hypothetical protein